MFGCRGICVSKDSAAPPPPLSVSYRVTAGNVTLNTWDQTVRPRPLNATDMCVPGDAFCRPLSKFIQVIHPETLSTSIRCVNAICFGAGEILMDS